MSLSPWQVSMKLTLPSLVLLLLLSLPPSTATTQTALCAGAGGLLLGVGAGLGKERSEKGQSVLWLRQIGFSRFE